MAKQLDTTNFDETIAKGVTLVDFWAAWCAPCRMIAPVIEDLSGKYEGQANIAKVNVDENPSLAQRYGINGIPAVLLFKDGQLVENSAGARSFDFYDKLVEQNLQVA